jgi:hypothetical protein
VNEQLLADPAISRGAAESASPHRPNAAALPRPICATQNPERYLLLLRLLFFFFRFISASHLMSMHQSRRWNNETAGGDIQLRAATNAGFENPEQDFENRCWFSKTNTGIENPTPDFEKHASVFENQDKLLILCLFVANSVSA